MNVGLIGLAAAQWTIAVDSEVTNHGGDVLVTDGFVQCCETVARVSVVGGLDTIGAIIPIWAYEALVAHAEDRLVTTVADCAVADVAACGKLGLARHWENSLGGGRLKAVCWVMAVVVLAHALDAEIVIVAAGAGHELVLWQDDHTAVACARCNARLLGDSLGLLRDDEGSRHILLSGPLNGLLDKRGNQWDGVCLAWRHTLSLAGDHFTILDESLDEPVALSGAVLALAYTLLAQIVVTAVTDGTVEVDVVHCLVALVAVNRPGAANGGIRLGNLASAKCERLLCRRIKELVEEVCPAVDEGTRHWSLVTEVDERLLRGAIAGLAEFENAAADRASIIGS
jgi:hypothetical protein